MKRNISHIIAVCALVCLTGCNDNLELFEYPSTEVPVAVEAAAVTPEALPGQIRLSWKAPEGDYAYLQIKYYDPLQKQDVCRITSKGTTEIIVENTRARFGEYTFYLQTFNSAHQGSEIKEVKARSGIAPVIVTETRRKVVLTASQLSTNAQEPTEGPISNLLDGKGNTFFHTRWSQPQIELPHYIQVNFKEMHEGFAIYYQNRGDDTWTTSARASVVELQISNDGDNWETVKTLSGLPNGHGKEYTSEYIASSKKYTHFRFLVTATSGNTKYFNMAEFAFYDVNVDVYDPETVTLD